MAAGSNFCRSEVFDVLSKTLQNLRFSSEESRPNDCDKGFLDIVDVSERQTFRKLLKVKKQASFRIDPNLTKNNCFVKVEIFAHRLHNRLMIDEGDITTQKE